MPFSDEDLLQLSGLQHFSFCRRQWALIHIEHQWLENWRTVDGSLMHGRAHDTGLRERRGDLLTIRGLSVVSRTLGISGQCAALCCSVTMAEKNFSPAGKLTKKSC